MRLSSTPVVTTQSMLFWWKTVCKAPRPPKHNYTFIKTARIYDWTLFECIALLSKLISNVVHVFLTDAFGRVIFTHLVADTRVIWETRSPTWDQLLLFKDLILWGDVNEIAVNPPTIVIEAFDKDIGVSQAFFVEISNLHHFLYLSSPIMASYCLFFSQLPVAKFKWRLGTSFHIFI